MEQITALGWYVFGLITGLAIAGIILLAFALCKAAAEGDKMPEANGEG